MLALHTYFRSSAAYRVRIGLNLKGLDYEAVPVHLVKDGGQQLSAEYRAINPNALVPALQDDGATITQSLAILEYLDETYPASPLLPSTPAARARVRSLALQIACDIHPLNNLRVLKYLVKEAGVSEETKNAWYVHWVEQGFAALELQLSGSPDTGKFCHGDTPTLADVVLVPQVFNAVRFKIDMGPYPTISRIVAECDALPAFAAAHPNQQADSE